MRARVLVLPTLFASFLVTGTALPAAAHCCHDERMLGTAQQSEFRRGTHGVGRRLGEDFEDDGPTVGRGLGSGQGALNNGGGLGQMHGNNVGNYGAGSLGERGPGGLGALQGDSIFRDPPRRR